MCQIWPFLSFLLGQKMIPPYTVNCLSQKFRSCSLFLSFCQFHRQSISKFSWLHFQNIFPISSFIFTLTTTTLGQSIMTHLGTQPFLPPSLAIYLLPSTQNDVFTPLTRSHFSSIENLQWLPITLGLNTNSLTWLVNPHLLLSLPTLPTSSHTLPTIHLILLLFPLP